MLFHSNKEREREHYAQLSHEFSEHTKNRWLNVITRIKKVLTLLFHQPAPELTSWMIGEWFRSSWSNERFFGFVIVLLEVSKYILTDLNCELCVWCDQPIFRNPDALFIYSKDYWWNPSCDSYNYQNWNVDFSWNSLPTRTVRRVCVHINYIVLQKRNSAVSTFIIWYIVSDSWINVHRTRQRIKWEDTNQTDYVPNGFFLMISVFNKTECKMW